MSLFVQRVRGANQSLGCSALLERQKQVLTCAGAHETDGKSRVGIQRINHDRAVSGARRLHHFESGIRVAVEVEDENVERRQQPLQVLKLRRIGIELTHNCTPSSTKSRSHGRAPLLVRANQCDRQRFCPIASGMFQGVFW